MSVEAAVGDDSAIDQMLAMKSWAVVGLGNNPNRDAFDVAATLIAMGHLVVPVHPKAETVHGQKGYATLGEIPFPIDVVDVFVNGALAGAIADEAVAIGAQGVWFQLGVVDEAAYERVTKAGLLMVMNRCSAIEHRRRG